MPPHMNMPLMCERTPHLSKVLVHVKCDNPVANSEAGGGGGGGGGGVEGF